MTVKDDQEGSRQSTTDDERHVAPPWMHTVELMSTAHATDEPSETLPKTSQSVGEENCRGLL